MIAALLCPGPSMLQTFLPWVEQHGWPELAIGVNRAALGVPLDWWAIQDNGLWTKISEDALGEPRVIACDALAATVRTWRGNKAVGCDVLRNYCPIRCEGWGNYTSTLALTYAAFLGASTIHVFGNDRAGQLDWDGVEGGLIERKVSHRTPARWETEAKHWKSISEWMGGRGLVLNHHSAPAGDIAR